MIASRLTAADLVGMFPALPTPFTADGQVDLPALTSLVEHLIDCGAAGLVPVGGTGEYTAMSPAARLQVVIATVEAARGRVPVIPGVLSPGFQEALETGRAFMAAGAAALLLVTPFYARPTAASLRAYFAAYTKDSGAPLLLYDIPGRTGVVVEPETVAGLVDDSSIVGMKACNTDLNHYEKVIRLVSKRIGVLSGDDYLYPIHAAMGGHGGILASSVLLPRYWQRIADLVVARKTDEAFDAHRVLVPFLDALFAQTNPGPLKAAFGLAGRPMGPVMLPLVLPDEALMARLRETMTTLANQGVDELSMLR
jgi:4-hydroxy-tetrahydrodipicolinate synthase